MSLTAFRTTFLRFPSQHPQKGRQRVARGRTTMWASDDAHYDSALAFSPATFLWEQDKSHVVELPAIWVKVPIVGRPIESLATHVDAAIEHAGGPRPHFIIADAVHVVAVWHIRHLLRPAPTRPARHHATFWRILESWRRAAIKLSLLLSPLGARVLDGALVDQQLVEMLPLPGGNGDVPRLLRGSDDVTPLRIADISRPLQQLDSEMFRLLGVEPALRRRRQWLSTRTSLAAFEPQSVGQHRAAAVKIASAARWDGEDEAAILQRLQQWATASGCDVLDEADLASLASWAAQKLSPGGPDRRRLRSGDAKYSNSDVIGAALVRFLREHGPFVGSKEALATQVAAYAQPASCPRTSLRRVLRTLKEAGALVHDVEHQGRTWRSTWRLAATSGSASAISPG